MSKLVDQVVDELIWLAPSSGNLLASDDNMPAIWAVSMAVSALVGVIHMPNVRSPFVKTKDLLSLLWLEVHFLVGALRMGDTNYLDARRSSAPGLRSHVNEVMGLMVPVEAEYQEGAPWLAT